jgi:hypothetical protein
MLILFRRLLMMGLTGWFLTRAGRRWPALLIARRLLYSRRF